jgi:MarR family 2-MHQ and catechol resistance regulon transcriptional repressor
VVTVGELFRVARLLREVAVEAATDPEEGPPSPGLVAVTDDVAHHDGTTVGEIAARTGLAQSFVSKVIAQLRDGGVIELAVDEADRRRNRISVTQAARREVFADRGSRTVSKALRERVPGLSDAQVARVEAALDLLARAL